MIHKIITLLTAIIFLNSCDSEQPSRHPEEQLKHLASNRELPSPNKSDRSDFKKTLRPLSFFELSELLQSLNTLENNRPPNHESWLIQANDLVDEIIRRQPDPLQFHSLLQEEGDEHFSNRFLLKRMAKAHHQLGWIQLKNYYTKAHRSNFQIATFGTAIPFFKSLQKHHPTIAREYFKKLSNPRKPETSHLQSDALSGILCAMEKPDEVLSFINWLRVENLQDQSVGSFGFDHRDFLKIDPTYPDLEQVISSAIIILTELSPSSAQAWIKNNQETSSLPNQWALCYIIGICRQDPDQLFNAYQFVAENTKPTDGILERLFQHPTISVSPEEKRRLLEIRQPSK